MRDNVQNKRLGSLMHDDVTKEVVNRSYEEVNRNSEDFDEEETHEAKGQDPNPPDIASFSRR